MIAKARAQLSTIRYQAAPESAAAIALGRNFNKVFVIGRNKTGTTTMHIALEQMGLNVGIQYLAEGLADDWLVRDFHRLIDYCGSAEAFQDVPFSLNYTYIAMDQAFPKSKFILTVRDTGDWYRSLLRFHFSAIAYKVNVDSFTRADPELISKVKEWSYIRKGWAYDILVNSYNLSCECELYDSQIFKADFEAYNTEVKNYFLQRPSDLLALDVSRERDTSAIVEFLSLPSSSVIPMPHENKAEDEANGLEGGRPVSS